MTVLLLAVMILLTVRLWMRLRETETTLASLGRRLAALETMRDPLGIAPIARIPVTDSPQPSAPGQSNAPGVTSPPTSATTPHVASEPVGAPRLAASARQRSSAADVPLEARIGSRWLLYVGVVAIIVGVGYFEKLAIDNHWLNETWRVMQGAIAGVALVLGGLRIVKKGYPLYGQILAGAGVAILYLSNYAAFNFYQLISYPAAFALMSAITVLSGWLGNAQNSPGLAVVAVSGGFATPFLLQRGTDAEAALFSYDAILIAGTMWLARRRDWPILNAVSYLFTSLTVLGWAAVFYLSAKYLVTEVFLTLFCALFLSALRDTDRSKRVWAPFVRMVLWTAPFGYYLLSLANLLDHSVALLVYLVTLALIGVVIGSRTNAWVRLAAWFAVVAPLIVWTSAHAGDRSWLVAGQAAWLGVYVLNLAGLFGALSGEIAVFGEADIALLHLTGLTTYYGLYVLPGYGYTDRGALIAAGFGVLNVAFAYFVRRRSKDQALHFLALAATFAVIVSALALRGPWITIGWATEGTVVTWLGLRERKFWLRAAGLTVFAGGVIRLLASQLDLPRTSQTLLLNSRGLTGLFVIALMYGLAELHRRYRAGQSEASTEVGVFVVGASLLTWTMLTAEIDAYWHFYDGRHSAAEIASLRFARELTLSLTWALYALILVVIGLMRKYAPIRYVAILGFIGTIAKVFMVDMSELDRIYRVLSVIGLGVALLVTSYLYQKLSADHART